MSIHVYVFMYRFVIYFVYNFFLDPKRRVQCLGLYPMDSQTLKCSRISLGWTVELVGVK